MKCDGESEVKSMNRKCCIHIEPLAGLESRSRRFGTGMETTQ
jgi:hypothetical protein